MAPVHLKRSGIVGGAGSGTTTLKYITRQSRPGKHGKGRSPSSVGKRSSLGLGGRWEKDRSPSSVGKRSSLGGGLGGRWEKRRGDSCSGVSGLVISMMAAERANYPFSRCRGMELLDEAVTDSTTQGTFNLGLENKLNAQVVVEQAMLYMSVQGGPATQLMVKVARKDNPMIFKNVELLGNQASHSSCFHGNIAEWLQEQSPTGPSDLTIHAEAKCSVGGDLVPCGPLTTVNPPMLLLDTARTHCGHQDLLTAG